MNTEPIPSGTDSPPSPLPDPAAAPLPISAERPDAAPLPGDDAVRIAFHVLALIAVVVLLAYCVIWAPRHRTGASVNDSTAASSDPTAITKGVS